MPKTKRPTEHASGPPEDAAIQLARLAFTSFGVEWKTELDRELLEQLMCVARIGGFRRATALACFVRPDTLKSWLEEGMRSDAPPLMRELSVRFQAIQSQLNLLLVGTVTGAAQRGDWMAAVAMLEKRETEWAGVPEVDLQPPELSLSEREKLLVDELKNQNSPLARLVKKCGYVPAPVASEPEREPVVVTPPEPAER